MADPVFVDANVPMYAVGAAHPLKQPCIGFLETIARGDIAALTDAEVLQEILHRYSALGQRERAVEVVRLFVQVVPIVLPITLDDVERALDVHERYAGLQARDSLHVAVMINNEIQRILSADQHFDDVDEVQRFDPALWPELDNAPSEWRL
jgi:predicted nucleic acid-binding protein